MPPALPDELGVGIRRGLVGGIAPLLPAEVDGRVPGIIVRGRRGWLVRGLHALMAGPGLQERPVHGKVLGRDEVRCARLGQNRREKGLGDVALEQPVPVLGKHGRIPDGIVHGQPNEPAEQEVVVQLLHELPLTPNAVELLQEQRAEELFRRDRGPTGMGVQQGEAGGEVLQGLIRLPPDRAEGVVLGDQLLRLNVAPHVALLGIAATHAVASW